MLVSLVVIHPVFTETVVSLVVSGIGGPTKHLLEQNAQAFNQITANLSTYKVNSIHPSFYGDPLANHVDANNKSWL